MSRNNKVENVSTYQQMRAVFQELDRMDDGYMDGQVSHVGLRRIILEVPEVEAELGTPMARALLIRAEQNLLGLMNFEEFLILAYELVQYSSGKYPNYNHEGKKNLNSPFQEIAVKITTPITERDVRLTKLSKRACLPPPILLLSLSMIQLALFVWYAVYQSARFKTITANGPLDIFSAAIFSPRRRQEFWRYVSYIFTQSGYFQFGFNFLLQILLGIPMELVHRWWRVIIIFFCGVLAGSLASAILDPYSYVTGSSPGVQALLFANFANVALNWKDFESAFLRLLAVALLSLVSTSVAIYYSLAEINSNLGFVSHMAGAVSGFLSGVVLLNNARTKMWQKSLWWISLFLQLLFFLVAIVWNAFLIALNM